MRTVRAQASSPVQVKVVARAHVADSDSNFAMAVPAVLVRRSATGSGLDLDVHVPEGLDLTVECASVVQRGACLAAAVMSLGVSVANGDVP